jgi:hypothetical protein
MIVLAAALMLAGADSTADLRHNFVECLKGAIGQAKAQKIAADGFIAFARTTCAASEEPFKSALVTVNVGHGMSRKDSAADASSQVSDYYSEWHDNYAGETEQAAASPK